MKDFRICVCIPTYNMGNVIDQTIRSILTQDYSNYEIIVIDNASTDNTQEVVRSFNSRKITYYRNDKNLGCQGNLEQCRKKATGDILYLMGADDILGAGALTVTNKAFNISEDIGAVTRPYYWFDKEINTPVRAKEQFCKEKNEVISINDDYKKIIAVFGTVDQISGLAFRRKYLDTPFHQDIFPTHVYPFAAIFKNYKVVLLKDYNVAVRIATSQSRGISSIYNKSPIQSWVEMFETVFKEEKFKKLRRYCISNFVAVNYVGLIQVRCSGKYRHLLREVFLLLKYRRQNIYNLKFWFFSLGTLILPRAFLIPLVDFFKNKVNSKLLEKMKIEFNYQVQLLCLMSIIL